MQSTQHKTPAYVLHTIKSMLAPIDAQVLHSLVLRIWDHFQFEASLSQKATYILSSYPEDLVCAAYHCVMRSNASTADILLDTMVAFMEPELSYRQMRYDHLLGLQEERA
jgi:hypothetical protein